MKSTNIKTSNFFVRMYRYFYNMDCYDTMPPGICDFVPKLIVACIFIMPFEIIGLPITIIQFFIPKNWKWQKHCPGTKAALTAALLFCLFILLFMALPIIAHWYPQKHEDIVGAIIVDVLFGIVILAFILHGIFGKYSMIGAYIRDKKEKMCTKINWIDDTV